MKNRNVSNVEKFIAIIISFFIMSFIFSTLFIFSINLIFGDIIEWSFKSLIGGMILFLILKAEYKVNSY